ncbi:hypothetical protein AN477_22305 [Alicyclobacillus ferrooxydans]|uniref:Glycosyltransferase 2-like domain-containing protein n=1 Tax=Alicyclobacillus ferrooxydans TaxID=471514 RepID=A0A0P9GIM8_9BACL|nr:hypothetical protein AN477_22305 [Alicyclobacillus ferrooxydans]
MRGPKDLRRYSSVVTVVIPSYNPGGYLKEAVKSVFTQTYKNWRMIIVDDASSDGSIASIREYLRDPRIRVIRNKKNMGQTKSLNVALKHVHTPFIVQLDSDDWFLPHTLQTLVKETRNIGPNVALISGNIKLLWRAKGGNPSKSLVIKGRQFKDKYPFLLSNKSCWPRFYRTRALRAVGGWPTDGPYEGRYIEDLRILFKLIPRYRFKWIDKTLYVHRRHNKSMTHHTQKMKKTLYWLIDKTLRDWGDEYLPTYRLLRNGYPQLKSLVPKRAL